MKRIIVAGTGSQAPYGIGEIIDTYRNTPAGLKKAMRRAAYWHTPAAVMRDGQRVEMDWAIIRDTDRGYVRS